MRITSFPRECHKRASGTCLGHIWDNIWSILSTMDNNPRCIYDAVFNLKNVQRLTTGKLLMEKFGPIHPKQFAEKKDFPPEAFKSQNAPFKSRVKISETKNMLIRDFGLFCTTFQHFLTKNKGFICNTFQLQRYLKLPKSISKLTNVLYNIAL